MSVLFSIQFVFDAVERLLDRGDLVFQDRDARDGGLIGGERALQRRDALRRRARPKQRARRLQQKSRHKGGRKAFVPQGWRDSARVMAQSRE